MGKVAVEKRKVATYGMGCTEEAEIIRSVMFIMAQEESRIRSERIKPGKRMAKMKREVAVNE